MSGYQPTFVPNQDDYGPTSPLATAANPVLANATKPTFKVNVHRNKTRRWVTARSYTYDGDDWGDSSDEHEDEDEEWEKEEQGRHLKNKGKDKAIEDIPPIPTLPPLKTSISSLHIYSAEVSIMLSYISAVVQ
ncbi:hypothetical protein KEM55_008265 [Ascosphaera atra]|nr:hypothetical protein KEM55_008265 [Ascosphaera atra]